MLVVGSSRVAAALLAPLLALTGCNSHVTGQAGGRACVTAASCGLIDGVSRCTANVAGVNLPYFSARAHISAEQVNCLSAAGSSCEAARRCLNAGMTPGACT